LLTFVAKFNAISLDDFQISHGTFGDFITRRGKSGSVTPLPEQDWDDIRQEVRAKLQQQKDSNKNR
jgi:hypothetical protein